MIFNFDFEADEILIFIFKLMMKIIVLISQAARLRKTGSGGGLGISLEGTVDVEEGVEVGGVGGCVAGDTFYDYYQGCAGREYISGYL